MAQGKVKFFDDTRGFGFITQDDHGDDLFMHRSAIVGDDPQRRLEKGDTVEYEVGEGRRGPQAMNVRPMP